MFVLIEVFLNLFNILLQLFLSVFFFFVIGHFTCRHVLILGTMVSFAFPLVSFVLSLIIACLSATHVRPTHICFLKSHDSVLIISLIATELLQIICIAVVR